LKTAVKVLEPGRSTPLICNTPNYPELAARAKLSDQNHQIPPGYKFSFASEALYRTLLDLLLSPEASRSFDADPRAFLDTRQGLSDEERRKLTLQHHGVTRMMFKRDPRQEAVRFVGAALLNVELATAYRDELLAVKRAFDEGSASPAVYESSVSEWLIEKGYATTPSAIRQATQEVQVYKYNGYI
jgi:hypothetical protein